MLVETILEIACLVACVIHAFIGFIHSLGISKKVNALCLKCGLPISVEKSHSCELTDVQIELLENFINSIRNM